MLHSKAIHALVAALQLLVIGALAENTTSVPDGKACLNHPNGTCLKSSTLATIQCPQGHSIAFSGCDHGEICCYPFVERIPKFEYGNDDCGITALNPRSRIVGGQRTSILKYPWMVSVQKQGSHVCGGAIVGDRWILTAAHCLVKYISSVTIVAGSSTKIHRGYSFHRRYYVSKILRHGRFVKGQASLGNDIALIKLSRPLDLRTSLTRKVCLPKPAESFAGQVCIAAGWGYLEEPVEGKIANKSSILRSATLPVMSKHMCRTYMRGLRPGTICAGYRSGLVDTCQGDSGGPLVCQDKNGIWKQAGVVSVGYGCARKNHYGIYTEVSSYMTWIRYVMEHY